MAFQSSSGVNLLPQVKLERLESDTARKYTRICRSPKKLTFVPSILKRPQGKSSPYVKLEKCFLCGQRGDVSSTDTKFSLSFENMNTVCSILGLESSNECFEAIFMLSKMCASCRKLYREIYIYFRSMCELQNSMEQNVSRIFKSFSDRINSAGVREKKCKNMKNMESMDALNFKTAVQKGEISDKQKI